jgi:hypothetical protein
LRRYVVVASLALLCVASAYAGTLLPSPSASASATPSRQTNGPPLNPAMESDALARSNGNDRSTARNIARALFARIQPAQILKITVDRVGNHRVVGIVLSGVKFHAPLDRNGFTDEVLSLVLQTFQTTSIEEIDLRAQVPIALGRGTVVSGDNAKPAFRDVFTLTAVRNESIQALHQRMDSGIGIFWDPWFVNRQLHL